MSELTHKEVAQKGGIAVREKFGKEHFSQLGQKSVAAKKAKGIFPFHKKQKDNQT